MCEAYASMPEDEVVRLLSLAHRSDFGDWFRSRSLLLLGAGELASEGNKGALIAPGVERREVVNRRMA
jgi:hypothetical protein